MAKKVKLKDIATIITGNTPKTSETKNYDSADIPFIKPSDISDCGIAKLKNSEFYISENARSVARIVTKDSILVTCIGIVGKIAILECESAFNQQINALIPKNNLVNVVYLAYALENQKKYMQDKANAAVVPIINKSQFSEIEIYLPSLDEQRRIAAILDKVTSLIALRKQQLAKLDELVKARFVEMFGDPVQNTKHFPTVKMGEACYLKAGITTSADEIHDYSDKYSVPCYGGNGIRGYVKNHTYEGTFPLIGRQGALCGNVRFATGKFHATEHAVLVTPLKGQNSIWLYYLLKYFDLNRFQTGAAQPGLAVKTLNQVKVLMVDVQEQGVFANTAIKVYKWGLTIQRSLDKLEVLQKLLIQQCFG